MTYRQWLKKAKKVRAAAVPDIRDCLPLTAETSTPALSRPVMMRRVIAGVAAAAVLVFAVGYAGFYALFSGDAGGTPAVSTPSGSPDEGEKLPLHTVVQAVTMLHSATPTMVVDNMIGYVGARLMYVTYNAPPEHSQCQGVFYEMEQQQYFCADHLMKPALEREGIPVKGLYMHYYHSVHGKIVFTCKDSARSSYVYDITNDTFHRLPVSLYYCPGVSGSLQTTHPYVLLHQMGGARDDLYLVNLLTAELSYILKDGKGNYLYTPMDDSQVTEDGKYVYYTLAEGGGDVVNSPARTTVLYEIATGKSRTFVGEVVSYLSDTERFFLNTPDGYVVYDIVSGERTPYAESDLPAYYAYDTKHTDIYTEFDYRLMLCNRITGEEKLVTNEYVVASVIHEQYLYYYIRGEEYLRVLDMVGGGVEYLPLDKALVQETESEANKERALNFGLQIEEDRGEVWVYYSVTDTPRQDAEAVRQEREKWPYLHLEELREAGRFNSIASLEPILRKFPDFTVTAYEGDGFIFLDYTALTDDGNGAVSNRLIALEDYDGGSFYTITHTRSGKESLFNYSKGGALAAEAERNTRGVLTELNIPIKEAYRDYRRYLSKEGMMQLELEALSEEAFRKNVRFYCVKRNHGYLGARMMLESPEELEELFSFVAFTDTLSYSKASEAVLMNGALYTVDFSGDYLIQMGRMNGKPYLLKAGYVADLTEEQYAKWSAWMDKQEQKGHLD